MPSLRPVLGIYARFFLSVLAWVNLGLGFLFYVIPDSMIVIWPWPVKALAVRFLGAIFVAVALGCLSALTAKLWQRAKVLVLVGGVFFGLTSIVSVAWGLAFGSGSAIWAWTAYFLIASGGCLGLLVPYGWHRKQGEPIVAAKFIPGSRLFFGVQTTVVGIFGTMMILLPNVAQTEIWPWKVATPTLQTFGGLFVATCFATGWAFFQKDLARVRVLLPLDAVFPSLALLAVGISWNVIVTESPSWLVTSVWLGLYSFVAVGSTLLCITLRPVSGVPR